MREEINENALKMIAGGSIVFNGDHTTCGYDCNDQYRVVDHDKCMSYMVKNIYTMDERDILSNCVALGYLEEL